MFERPSACLLAILFFLGAAPYGTPPGDTAPSGSAAPAAFSQTERAAILAGAGKAVGDYTFAEKIPAIRATLEAHRDAYLQIGDPKQFADAVNADLYAVAHDKHLRIKYSALAAPMYGSEQHGASLAHLMQSQQMLNYGYAAAIRLAGNVGYLRLDEFGPMPQSKGAIDSAMAFLAHTDALVVDVRANHGGDPDSLDYLMGYFYAKPVELTSILVTQGGKSQLFKQFSEAHVTGPRYLGRPLYVLTSDHTFSCAEQFSYDMQALHRATLIGQTTGGGANPGGFVPLDPHFAIFVPLGRAVNPYTKTNWEGVGVVPDLSTESAAALLTAYTQALGSARNTLDEAAAARSDALKDPAKALAASLPSI
jgi:retinol-binding protein 3